MTLGCTHFPPREMPHSRWRLTEFSCLCVRAHIFSVFWVFYSPILENGPCLDLRFFQVTIWSSEQISIVSRELQYLQGTAGILHHKYVFISV